jgi:hypothetical protein
MCADLRPRLPVHRQHRRQVPEGEDPELADLQKHRRRAAAVLALALEPGQQRLRRQRREGQRPGASLNAETISDLPQPGGPTSSGQTGSPDA